MRTMVKRVQYAVRALLGRRRAEQDLDDELRFHVEYETERGRTLTIDADARERVTVIGIVGDIRHDGLVGDITPHLYWPASTDRRRFIVLRAEGTTDPVTLTRAAQQAIAKVDANVPATIRPMRDIMRENGFQWSISALALSAFGVTALLLAGLGLYGVIAYTVAERRHELAIRLAIGARAAATPSQDVLRGE